MLTELTEDLETKGCRGLQVWRCIVLTHVAHSAAVSSLTCSLLLFTNPHKPVLDGSSAVRAGSSDLKSLHVLDVGSKNLKRWDYDCDL